MGNGKTLVIGLDGMPWSILDALIERGIAKNLGRIRDSGAYGTLRSTIPPVTGPAWVAYATAMNPGRTGIFDFVKVDKGLNIRPITTQDIDAQTYYEALDLAKKRSLIVNLPVSYPQRRIDGVIVTSLLTQNRERIFFPASQRPKYEKYLQHYSVDAPYPKSRDIEASLGFIGDLEGIQEGCFGLARALMKGGDWAHIFVLFSATDWMFHHGVGHLLEKDGEPRIKKAMENLLGQIDDHVGELMELAGEDTTTFIISDHGHTTTKWRFHINQWLLNKNLAKTKVRAKRSISGFNMAQDRREGTKIEEKGASVTTKLITRMGQVRVMNRMMLSLKQFLENRLGREVTTGGELTIDKEASLAFSHTSESLGISINVLHERWRSMRDEQQQEFIETLIRDLEKVEDPKGKRVMEGVWRREDVFVGGHTSEAPRIIFIPKPGIASYFNPSPRVVEEETRFKGWHTMEGILLAKGPNIRSGRIEGANLIDMAPTIMASMGLTLDGERDGRIIGDIFKKIPKTRSVGNGRPDRETGDKEKETIKRKIARLKKMKGV